jgi:hypothetical protein
VGREAEGTSAGVAARCSPIAGMRLARSLPSAPSASTRDPLRYFNSLLSLQSTLISGQRVPRNPATTQGDESHSVIFVQPQYPKSDDRREKKD